MPWGMTEYEAEQMRAEGHPGRIYSFDYRVLFFSEVGGCLYYWIGQWCIDNLGYSPVIHDSETTPELACIDFRTDGDALMFKLMHEDYRVY